MAFRYFNPEVVQTNSEGGAVHSSYSDGGVAKVGQRRVSTTKVDGSKIYSSYSSRGDRRYLVFWSWYVSYSMLYSLTTKI